MMTAKFFATPTAVRQWIEKLAPESTYEEALEDILDWSSDAIRQRRPARNGAALYRTRRPLDVTFMVDESQSPLPAITAVLPAEKELAPGAVQALRAFRELGDRL